FFYRLSIVRPWRGVSRGDKEIFSTGAEGAMDYARNGDTRTGGKRHEHAKTTPGGNVRLRTGLADAQAGSLPCLDPGGARQAPRMPGFRSGVLAAGRPAAGR